MTLTLTPAELREVTGARRRDAQARVLAHLGVPFAVRPDGTIVVLRAVTEALLGASQSAAAGRPEPQLMP